MAKKKIMIVDDNEDFLKELEQLLEMSGYDVAAFTSAASALVAVNVIKPDAILVDLKMDGMSGFKMAEELSKVSGTAAIPRLAMTAHYDEVEHRGLISSCGFRGCLMKPFNPLDVINKVEELV